MAFSFGRLSNIDIDIATLAFIVTVLFMLAMESLTKIVERSVKHSTVYNGMLQKIYKELMIMGFVTLILAMYTASHKLSEDATEAINIADIIGFILFFVAIFFVAHALFIMFISIVMESRYVVLHEMSVADCLNSFIDATTNPFQRVLIFLRYLYVPTPLRNVEFKIIYSLFRDTYSIPSGFDYGMYLSHCLSKFSSKMININISSWAVMILLAVLNYSRVKYLHLDFGNCSKYISRDRNDNVNNDILDEYNYAARRSLTTIAVECHKQHLQLYMICGGMLVLYTLGLLVVGRVYGERLMTRVGVNGPDEYEEFLTFEEGALLENEKRRLEVLQNSESDTPETAIDRHESTSNFKTQVDQMRAMQSNVAPENESHAALLWKKAFKKVSAYTNFVNLAKGTKVSDEASVGRLSAAASRRSNMIFRLSSSLSSCPDDDNESPPNVIRRTNSTKQPNYAQRRRRSHIKANISPEILTVVEQFRLKKASQSQRGELIFTTQGRSARNDKKGFKVKEDFSEIYLFHSPKLYSLSVEVAIMLNSLYLSLWITNFITVVDVYISNSLLWQIIMLIPIAIVLPCIGEIVKDASLLEAIAELDMNIIGMILEDEEDRKVLVDELRRKVLKRIRGSELEQKQILRDLFEEIDSDYSGYISTSEFRDMLGALHLHYSDRKFTLIFQEIDKDRSGTLSMTEIHRLIFPNSANEEDILRRTNLLQKVASRRSIADANISPTESGNIVPLFSFLSPSSRRSSSASPGSPNCIADHRSPLPQFIPRFSAQDEVQHVPDGTRGLTGDSVEEV